MSDETPKKYVSDKKFGDFLHKINDLEMLKQGKKLFDDLIMINDLKEKIKEMEEDLYDGKRGAFAMFTERMDPNQTGLFASSLEGRLKLLKKKLGIVDPSKNQVIQMIVDNLVKAHKSELVVQEAADAYRKETTSSNSQVLNAVQRIHKQNMEEVRQEREKIDEQIEELGYEISNEEVAPLLAEALTAIKPEEQNVEVELEDSEEVEEGAAEE